MFFNKINVFYAAASGRSCRGLGVFYFSFQCPINTTSSLLPKIPPLRPPPPLRPVPFILGQHEPGDNVYCSDVAWSLLFIPNIIILVGVVVIFDLNARVLAAEMNVQKKNIFFWC